MQRLATHQRASVRRADVMALRLKGLSYHAIGTALGISHMRAAAMVREAIDEANKSLKETTEQVRAMELQRLDALMVKMNDLTEADDALVDRLAQELRSLVTAAEAEGADVTSLNLKIDQLVGRARKVIASPEATRTILKIMERRAALLGLDAPKTFMGAIDVSVAGEVTDGRAMLEQKLADMRKRLSAPDPLAALTQVAVVEADATS